MSQGIQVSPVRSFLRDFPLAFLMPPLLFAWAGTIAMAAGLGIGRRGRSYGPELLPVVAGIACLLTIILVAVAVMRYRRFKSIAESGTEIEGEIGPTHSQSGLMTINYSYEHEGKQYEKSYRLPSLFTPSEFESGKVVVVVDSKKPSRAFLRDLLCTKR